MQHRIIKPSRLLNKHGELIQKGYATSPILKYRRKDVAHKSRLKEWDYYLIYNEEFAVALTIGKSTSLVMVSASLIDLIHRKQTTKTSIGVVSDNKFSMPESSEVGDIIYQDLKTEVAFLHKDGFRELTLKMKSFFNKDDLDIHLTLTQEPQDSMVIATPFQESKTLFYYNQKTIGMFASGTAKVGTQTFNFLPCQSFALLDWGRGCWPYHTTWLWSAAQGMIDNDLFGFNLGYGFGDTSRATENMLFMNGTATKLENVIFHIPKNKKKQNEYMKPWHITSSDGRIEMKFEPIIDRSANVSALVLSTNQHQVFGKFSGVAILDDGNIVMINDFLGFAERVENRW